MRRRPSRRTNHDKWYMILFVHLSHRQRCQFVSQYLSQLGATLSPTTTLSPAVDCCNCGEVMLRRRMMMVLSAFCPIRVVPTTQTTHHWKSRTRPQGSSRQYENYGCSITAAAVFNTVPEPFVSLSALSLLEHWRFAGTVVGHLLLRVSLLVDAHARSRQENHNRARVIALLLLAPCD